MATKKSIRSREEAYQRLWREYIDAVRRHQIVIQK